MRNEHVLGGLLRKRAELAGELKAAQARVQQLIVDIDAVEATMGVAETWGRLLPIPG